MNAIEKAQKFAQYILSSPVTHQWALLETWYGEYRESKSRWWRFKNRRSECVVVPYWITLLKIFVSLDFDKLFNGYDYLNPYKLFDLMPNLQYLIDKCKDWSEE